MARTPFRSHFLFPVSFNSCVIQSVAKNPGFLCPDRPLRPPIPRPLFLRGGPAAGHIAASGEGSGLQLRA
jgi:hypothetical protein